MKERPVLFSAIIFTLVIEVLLVVLAYHQAGSERLPYQLARIGVQLFFISIIILNKSNIGIYLLTTYHIVTAVISLTNLDNKEFYGIIIFAYHLLIGFIILFHDVIESWLKIKRS